VLDFQAATNRSGNVVERPRRGRRRAGERFDIRARFSDDPPDQCRCCEYRQYVRGTMTIDGAAIPHHLQSGPLDPEIFREDCDPRSAHPCYGHRDTPGDDNDAYSPDQEAGCRYLGSDFPSIAGRLGARFSIDLEYRGEIIDRCRGDAIVDVRTWTVRFSGRLSRRRRYWD
jgi:hypothetical protein